jgi:hypothetical protein
MDISLLDALPIGRVILDLIGNCECLVEERAELDRRQFPLGAAGFVPQGKAVIVQLL